MQDRRQPLPRSDSQKRTEVRPSDGTSSADGLGVGLLSRGGSLLLRGILYGQQVRVRLLPFEQGEPVGGKEATDFRRVPVHHPFEYRDENACGVVTKDGALGDP